MGKRGLQALIFLLIVVMALTVGCTAKVEKVNDGEQQPSNNGQNDTTDEQSVEDGAATEEQVSEESSENEDTDQTETDVEDSEGTEGTEGTETEGSEGTETEGTEDADKEEATEVVEEKDLRYVATDMLNVRSEATVRSDILGNLPRGFEIAVVEELELEDGSKWLKFNYDKAGEIVEAWVYGKLTTTEKTTIAKPYSDVDYSPYDKTTGFKSNPPVKAKALFITGHSATNSKLDELVKAIKETELNALVIDVKDDNGTLLFHSETAESILPSANDRVHIKDDIEGFVKRLRDEDIYLIARVVTFKSPKYAKAYPERSITYKGSSKVFSNRDGAAWASPYDRQLWDYNLGIAKEAAALGFNEIQFDYVRFPATGSKLDKSLDFRNDLGESKPLAIQSFLKYAREDLNAMEAYVAADVFGWAATSQGDVGIGQHWEALTNVVDYICPMVYPSHYGPGNFGLAVPDANPYATINYSTKDALMRNANVETPALIRPWIQDFTATWVKGHISYGTAEVKAQIKALKDNGVEEYLIWNAANRYHLGAYEKVEE